MEQALHLSEKVIIHTVWTTSNNKIIA